MPYRDPDRRREYQRGRGPGPAVGTEGECVGCGQTYTRTTRGQWYCSGKCYRLHGDWSPTTIPWGLPVFDPDRRTRVPYQ